MDKRKYLVRFSLSLFFSFLSLKVSANSLWLPAKGKYNIAISTAYTDEKSEDLKLLWIFILMIKSKSSDLVTCG